MGSDRKHEGSKKKEPLNPVAGTPSENSRLHAATRIQSSVTPEDYPAEKRRMQTAAATDGAQSRPVPTPRNTRPAR